MALVALIGSCTANNEFSGAWSFLEIRWNAIQSINCSNVIVESDGDFACGNGVATIVGSIADDGAFTATVDYCGDNRETTRVTGTCPTAYFCSGNVDGSCADNRNTFSFTR